MVGLYPSPTTDCIIDNGTKSADISETHLLHMHTLVIVVVVVLVLILLAIGGNVLVLLSYANDHRLHTISNLYLVHLAVCDIIIGASSMSFDLHFTVHKWEWTLGQVACKVYLAVDYVASLQTVLLIMLISIDRLLMLRKGIHYATTETKTKVYLKISFAWLISFLLYAPAIIGWNHWVGSSSLPPKVCHVEFHTNRDFMLTVTFLDTLVPIVVLSVVNGIVFCEIRKRTGSGGSGALFWRSVTHARTEKAQPKDEKSESTDGLSSSTEVLNSSPSRQRRENDTTESLNLTKPDTSSPILAKQGNFKQTLSRGKRERSQGNFKQTLSRGKRERTQRQTTRTTQRYRKDFRAAWALFWIVLTFVVTWVPYSVCAVIHSFCDECVQESVFQTAGWILLLKSSINPFLYAFTIKRFRINFRRILCKVFVWFRSPCRVE